MIHQTFLVKMTFLSINTILLFGLFQSCVFHPYSFASLSVIWFTTCLLTREQNKMEILEQRF